MNWITCLVQTVSTKQTLFDKFQNSFMHEYKCEWQVNISQVSFLLSITGWDKTPSLSTLNISFFYRAKTVGIWNWGETSNDMQLTPHQPVKISGCALVKTIPVDGGGWTLESRGVPPWKILTAVRYFLFALWMTMISCSPSWKMGSKGQCSSDFQWGP